MVTLIARNNTECINRGHEHNAATSDVKEENRIICVYAVQFNEYLLLKKVKYPKFLWPLKIKKANTRSWRFWAC